MIKRRISQEDMGDINVQGLGNATTHENAEDDEILQNEGNSTCKMFVEVIASEILEAIIRSTSKRPNQSQLEEITIRVNKAIYKTPTRPIAETNNLINEASFYIAKEAWSKTDYKETEQDGGRM